MSEAVALQSAEVGRLIAARKYALVLSPEHQRPHGLVMKLRANDFRVASTNRPRDILKAIDRTPWLSLLILDGPADTEEVRTAISDVNEKHPELPVLCIRPEGSAPIELPYGTVFAGHTDVLQKAEELLSQRFYPEFIVDGAMQAGLETLRDGFRTEVEFLRVSLKLTRNAMGTIIPVLPFNGPGVSGHLVLNAASSQLRAIRQKVLPKKGAHTVQELGDCGGEILNQTVGRLKAHLSRYGVPIDLGLPMVIHGTDLSLRFPRAAPALVFDFGTLSRHVYLEFSLTSMDLTGAHPEQAAETEQIDAGDLTFL